jgi:hypothetical protein
VWDNFDRRQKAKAKAANANDGDQSGEAPKDDGDMFSAAGVAAE